MPLKLTPPLSSIHPVEDSTNANPRYTHRNYCCTSSVSPPRLPWYLSLFGSLFLSPSLCVVHYIQVSMTSILFSQEIKFQLSMTSILKKYKVN